MATQMVIDDVSTWPVLKVGPIPNYRKPQQITHYAPRPYHREIASIEPERLSYEVQMPPTFEPGTAAGCYFVFEAENGPRFPGIVTELRWEPAKGGPVMATVQDLTLEVG